MALINIHPFRKKKTPEELEEERRLKEEETKAAFAGGGEGIIEQSELPGKEEGPRKISLEEKKRLLQQNPGSAVDEFGKVSPPLTDRFGNKTAEGKERIFGTQELAAGAGIPTREIEKQAREKAVREQRLLGIMEKAQAGLATAEELAVEKIGMAVSLIFTVKEAFGNAAFVTPSKATARAEQYEAENDRDITIARIKRDAKEQYRRFKTSSGARVTEETLAKVLNTSLT